MKQKLILASMLIFAAKSALAHEAPPPPPESEALAITQVPCAEAQSILHSQGLLVLAVDPERVTQVVQWPSNCHYNERAVRTTMPTLDTPACELGFTCEPD